MDGQASGMSAVAGETEQVPCPGCGGEQWTVARVAGNPTLEPELRFQIVCCDACGLHYTNPRPLLSTLGRFYPKEYSPYQSEGSPAAGAEGSIKNLVLREAFGAPAKRPGMLGQAVAGAIQCVRRPESFGFGVPWRGEGRLLDFGCGSGKFLRRMHALGWDVTGIDFSEEAVSAVRVSGLKALQGTLPHEELKPFSFDVVAMRHALEHVPEPLEILRRAWELVDGGGLLFISVPNYRSLEIEKLGEAAMGLDLPRHLTHFEPHTLHAMMKRAGLPNVRVRQWSRANWIRKAAKRAKQNDTWVAKVATRSGGAQIASIVAEIHGFGNELIATAVKK